MLNYNDVKPFEKDDFGTHKILIGLYVEEDIHGHCPYCDNYIDETTNIFGKIKCGVCGQVLCADDFLEFDYDLDDKDLYNNFN